MCTSPLEVNYSKAFNKKTLRTVDSLKGSWAGREGLSPSHLTITSYVGAKRREGISLGLPSSPGSDRRVRYCIMARAL